MYEKQSENHGVSHEEKVGKTLMWRVTLQKFVVKQKLENIAVGSFQ